MQRLIFVAAFVAFSVVTGVAVATPEFPAIVQSDVGAAAPPPCTICHNSLVGGLGTVTTTFGVYLRSRGLLPYDDDSLRTALAADRGENHISNAQGISDIEALMEGLDPNHPTGGGGARPPEYGCVARIAPSAAPVADAGLVAALSLLPLAVLLRRRRRLVHAERASQ